MSEQEFQKVFEEQNKRFEKVQQNMVNNCFNQTNNIDSFMTCAVPFLNKFEEINKVLGLSMVWVQMNIEKQHSNGASKEESINSSIKNIKNIFDSQLKDLE